MGSAQWMRQPTTWLGGSAVGGAVDFAQGPRTSSEDPRHGICALPDCLSLFACQLG